jgi:hypothetical protein
LKDIAAALAQAASSAAANTEFAVALLDGSGTGIKGIATKAAEVSRQTAVPGLHLPPVLVRDATIPSPIEPRASHIVDGEATHGSSTSYRDVLALGLHGSGPDSTPLSAPASAASGLLPPSVPPSQPVQGPNPFQHLYHLQPTDAVDSEEAADLVHSLIVLDTAARATAADALTHPFFWSTARKFLFIQTVSESIVVNADRAAGHYATFAADIQTHFQARLPPGCTSWAAAFKPPAALGPEGWSSELWKNKNPAEYEHNYAGPYSMYSLVRFVRNFYVHGPEHIRQGFFESLGHLQAYLLSCWPWLVIELYRVDMRHGGRFTAFTLAGGTGQQATVLEGGVDADVDAVCSDSNVGALGSPEDSSTFTGVEVPEEIVPPSPLSEPEEGQQYAPRQKRDSFINCKPTSRGDASDDETARSHRRTENSYYRHRQRFPSLAEAQAAMLQAYDPSDDEHATGTRRFSGYPGSGRGRYRFRGGFRPANPR